MITVRNSCPYYRYKPKENKVTNCKGHVDFQDGNSTGVCRSCGKEVPMMLEM